MAAHRLLLLDGLTRRRLVLRMAFARRGWVVTAVDTVAGALAALLERPGPCCLLVALQPALPDGRGEDVLERCVAMGSRARLVVCPVSKMSIFSIYTYEYRKGKVLPTPVSLAEIWDDRCPACEDQGRSRGPPERHRDVS